MLSNSLQRLNLGYVAKGKLKVTKGWLRVAEEWLKVE